MFLIYFTITSASIFFIPFNARNICELKIVYNWVENLMSVCKLDIFFYLFLSNKNWLSQQYIEIIYVTKILLVKIITNKNKLYIWR